MIFDSRRINAKRRDCFPIFKVQNEDCCIATSRESLVVKLMKMYTTVLLKWPSKVIVVLIECSLLAFGIYGALHLSQEFTKTTLVPEGAYFRDFVEVAEGIASFPIPVSLVKLGTHNYSDSVTQYDIDHAVDVVLATGFYERQQLSWLEFFRNWATINRQLDFSKLNFTANLQEFLAIPQFAHFNQDLEFSSSGDIIASRTHVFMIPIFKSSYHRDGMLKTREALSSSGTDSIAASIVFLFAEQYAAVVGELVRGLTINALAIMLVVTPFCINPLVIIILFTTFALQIVQLIGWMYLCNISLNAISMITITMSIGFTVDYTAHVASAFSTSAEKTAHGRVVYALNNVGRSVAMGGFSTFAGMIVTFFVTSPIVHIVFRILSGTVLFGLFHGLVFLPVVFSFLRVPLKH